MAGVVHGDKDRLMELPPCMHRGKRIAGNWWACGTDHFEHSGMVPGSLCRQCRYANLPRLKSSGLGDTIHKATHALGLDKLGCGGCKDRMTTFNELVPYKDQE